MNFGMGSLNFVMLPFLIALVIGNDQAEAESAEIESSITVFKTDIKRLRSRICRLVPYQAWLAYQVHAYLSEWMNLGVRKYNKFEMAMESTIGIYEMVLKDKDNDLNIKRNLLTEREKEIEVQTQTIVSVQNMIEVLKEKESGNAITLAKAYARMRELETQVKGLKESVRKQKKEQAYFKLQLDEAEKKAKDQASKNEKIEYFVSEQWVTVQQTEQALLIAEAIMLKAQAEVALKVDDLSKNE